MCQLTLGYPCGFREVPPKNLGVTGHAMHVMYLGVSQRIPTFFFRGPQTTSGFL